MNSTSPLPNIEVIQCSRVPLMERMTRSRVFTSVVIAAVFLNAELALWNCVEMASGYRIVTNAATCFYKDIYLTILIPALSRQIAHIAIFRLVLIILFVYVFSCLHNIGRTVISKRRTFWSNCADIDNNLSDINHIYYDKRYWWIYSSISEYNHTDTKENVAGSPYIMWFDSLPPFSLQRFLSCHYILATTKSSVLYAPIQSISFQKYIKNWYTFVYRLQSLNLVS